MSYCTVPPLDRRIIIDRDAWRAAFVDAVKEPISTGQVKMLDGKLGVTQGFTFFETPLLPPTVVPVPYHPDLDRLLAARRMKRKD